MKEGDVEVDGRIVFSLKYSYNGDIIICDWGDKKKPKIDPRLYI
jgi:hypothetical protein